MGDADMRYTRKTYSAKTTKSDIISQARVKKGLTIKEIGVRLGLSKDTVKAYFCGYIMPTDKRIEEIGELLNIDYFIAFKRFKSLHTAWGKAHPNYIDVSGVWRSPSYKRGKKKDTAETNIAPKKDKPFKAWTRVHNFWADERARQDCTLEEVADKLNRHRLTVRGYFTGFNMPSREMVKALCDWWDIDFNKGYAEFQKIHEAWGKAHPNYVNYGCTYVVKGTLEADRARNNARQVRKKAGKKEKPLYWHSTTQFTRCCRKVYGKLSFDDYTSACRCKSLDEFLEFIYGKVEGDIFIEILKEKD